MYSGVLRVHLTCSHDSVFRNNNSAIATADILRCNPNCHNIVENLKLCPKISAAVRTKILFYPQTSMDICTSDYTLMMVSEILIRVLQE